MRTYAGHSSARESNALFRKNLSRGQTGLSIAFDLPTQCGYDADHPLARGEVGKVGVPVSSLADMERCTPVLEHVAGWTTPTAGMTRYEDLPAEAKAYIKKLEGLIGAPIDLISTGPQREESIVVRPIIV